VLAEPDDIILLGALVARELYGIECPIVVADAATYQNLRTGDRVTVSGTEIVPA